MAINQKQICEKIKNLRQKANMSQDDFAKLLNVSRVTFSQIEQWERELKQSELIVIADKFEISLDELIKPEISKTKPIVQNKEEDPFYKFKQVFLYILNKCAGKPSVGKTVLNKLLYFADFNYFEKYMTSITGVEYIKLPKWPVPQIMDLILPNMESNQLIKQIEVPYFGYIQYRILPLVEPDMGCLSASEKTEIDNVLDKYSDRSADWLSERSHNDMPYKATKNIWEIISYWLSHYRDNMYSVKERKDEDEIKSDQALYDHSLQVAFAE